MVYCLHFIVVYRVDCMLFVTRRSGMGTMRRGMLMTVLHQYALEQPIWEGKAGER